MKAECEAHDPQFETLKQEFKDLIANCPPEEAAILRDRFDHLMNNYSKMEDLIKNREDLCDNWGKYAGDHKETQAKLKTLQAKLASPDIKEEEVEKINKEVAALRKSMAPWARQADQLDALMGDSHMVIKDRATQRTLHFNSELQALENLCDSVAGNAQQKQGHLMEVSQLWDEFSNRKDNLVAKLHEIGEKIDGAAVDDSSLAGVKELVRETEVKKLC